ncbi:MAG: phytanoyl-CoA dioxygenase family protein [Acidimicrobiales bacterium]|nr:phytanoyl-CoA dioxygenase family protein [Acidimicrobiales bacterium]
MTPVRDRIDALRDAGDPVAALDAAIEALRGGADPALESLLVELRHEAFFQAAPPVPVAVEPEPPRPRSGADLPELARDELTADALRDGIATHGCVLVRGLIDESEAGELRDGIDRTFAAFDDRQAGHRDPDDAPWFTPFTPSVGDYRIGGRKFMRESGGVWTVDSPRMMFVLTELIERHGLGDLVADYLGERPALSANKCNLRRVPVDTQTNWHQDGAFLGREVRSLNLWLALGPCGVDAPALDLVPRRLDRIVETGTPGAMFDWSVAPDKVAEAAGDVAVVRPTFEAGDALFFDHLFLHRTGVSEGMTSERHAIESWFFAPSSYPDGQIPILL